MDPEKVIIDEGVTVSSPDTPEQDVNKTEDQEPGSMLDAVLAEVEGEPSDPTSEAADGKEGAEGADPKPDADGKQPAADAAEGTPNSDTDPLPEGDPTEEEMANYSQKANQRIRGLVEERNHANAQYQAVAPMLDYMQKNDIPMQDVDVILGFAACLRNGDFAGFLQGVQPYIDLAQQYTGQALPADLQQQVQQGYVSPEIAKELSQRRAQVHVQNNDAQLRQNADKAQIAQMRADNIRSAVTSWEQQIRQSDPDYDLKADMVRRTSQAMMQEHGTPQTPEQALQLAKAAYDEVNGQAQRFRPAPKATSRNPNSTGQQGGSSPKAEPTSMMEAAMQGLEAQQNRG